MPGERINEAANGSARGAEGPAGQAALGPPSSPAQSELVDGERQERARGMNGKGKRAKRKCGHGLNSAEKHTDKYKFNCLIFTHWIS